MIIIFKICFATIKKIKIHTLKEVSFIFYYEKKCVLNGSDIGNGTAMETATRREKQREGNSDFGLRHNEIRNYVLPIFD